MPKHPILVAGAGGFIGGELVKELYLEEFPLESTSPALMTTFQVAHAY